MPSEIKDNHASSGRLGGLKGGKARAEALTPEERSTIAQKAARSRWKTPRATHMGVLPIAGMSIPCAVLSSGDRVLSQRGFYAALGASKPGGRGQDPRADDLPRFLAAKSLEPYISGELRATLSTPIVYEFLHDNAARKGGASKAHGINAKLIPEICEVFLTAREAGALQHNQLHVAKAAEVLVRGLARVGIIALVDEATGYQADRDREELSRILEAYIIEELRPWVRVFPHEFFKQMHRLQGWAYTDKQTKHPQYAGKLINQYIYDRLPPGVHEELRKLNPVVDGRRKHKHFQHLTDHTGIPHLDKQITAVTTLLAVSDDKAMFESLLRKRFPKAGDQIPLPLTMAARSAEAEED
jgi:hypothetical protein